MSESFFLKKCSFKSIKEKKLQKFFLEFLTKCLSECPNFTKPPQPGKISGCAPAPVATFDTIYVRLLTNSYCFKNY